MFKTYETKVKICSYIESSPSLKIVLSNVEVDCLERQTTTSPTLERSVYRALNNKREIITACDRKKHISSVLELSHMFRSLITEHS